MKVSPIKSPLAGEQVVSVDPEIKTFTDKDWRKRLNYFTGRSLTHTAFRIEQGGRSGRIATLGQMLSPGVIFGLEADKASNLNADGVQQTMIHISPGSGISASGEIVTLNQPIQARIKDIRVYAPVSLSETGEETEPLDTTTDDGVTVENSSDLSGILARRLGLGIQEMIDAGQEIPSAAILVLQPVQVEMQMQQEDDPCELDPANYAYENWQLVDGARLVLYSWPEEVLTLPEHNMAWRNRLANQIFTLEQNLFADQLLPWMNVGVPIALIGFDEDWEPLFIDRNSVVRSGGKRRRTTSVLPNVGNRFLSQARFEQFNEHIADLVSDAAIDDLMTGSANAFRYLPPIGVLPKHFIDLRQLQHNFFPLNYHVEAVVIPYEQLDVVVQDSAALESFDLNRADRIQTLVPVPQIYYEPDLLNVETIDPEFDGTIQRFTETRNNWLGRRLEIRRKASTINKVMKGESLTFAEPDPDAVDNQELATPFENAIVEFGATWRYFKGVSALPANWNQAAFNHSSWLTGPTGIGYGAVGNETELDDMQGQYVSVFCRKTFSLSLIEVDQAKNYKLVIVTNGGFSAYLNGQEIANNNLSNTQFNALADSEIESVAVEFDLGGLNTTLNVGENILAIQAHNHHVMSPHYTFVPRLIEKQYVDDIETDDYSMLIKLDQVGKPVLEDFEPVYETAAFEALRNFVTDQSFLSNDEKTRLDTLGIEKYIDYLQEKVNKANDKVDFGFLHLQTNIYRVRQFILGNVEASKLATSPVLASIAQGDTAFATKEEIETIASRLYTSDEVEVNTSGSGNTATSVNALTQSVAGSNLFISGDLGAGFTETVLGDNLTGGLPTGVNFDLPPIVPKDVLNRTTISSGVLLGSTVFKPVEIEEQSFIVGNFQSFNNVTVGERLKQPVSNEAKNAGWAAKAGTLQGFLDFDFSIGDLEIPGFKQGENDVTKKFSEIDQSTISEILSGIHDPHGDDEASLVNSGIKAMENTSAFLRLLEGRIKAYKLVIARSKSAIVDLRQILGRADTRLKIIADELAETRHDVTVSRALKAEESERITAINVRRQAIIEEHVPFLVFRRPRLSDLVLSTPVHTLHPDLSEAPLPVCNVNDEDAPEEISAMMDVIREAPLKWFVISKTILKRINRLNDLRGLIKSAKSRAKTKTTKHRLLNAQYDGLNRLALGINKTLRASDQAVSLLRQQTALIDLASFDRIGWNETQTRAEQVISLGDIIDGNHGRMGASKTVAQELEQIERVAICLYTHFAEVLPSIKLDWAERLSQFDASVNLRNLYSLPRWGDISFLERNAMQRQVDWLYQRIVTVHSDASNMINDLIRICILLASHAPTNKIVSGLVPEAKSISVGDHLNIIADLALLRIGMNIAVVSGSKTVARGRVEDIVGGQVTAQIVSTLTTTVAIEKDAKVQIGAPRSLGGIAY